MNCILERIYETGFVEDRNGKLIQAFPAGIPYYTGIALSQLIKNENLDRTLEVGMAYGLSTLFICQAHKDKGKGTHTAIDPYQNRSWKSIGLENIKKSCLDNVLRFIETSSHLSLPQLLAAREKFDFAFIDGAHAFEYAFVDFFYIDQLLAPGSYLVFDDLWSPAIRKIVSFVLRNRSYQLVKTSTTKHLPLLQRAKKVGRRLLQNPLEIDHSGFKFSSENICILKKVADDGKQDSSHVVLSQLWQLIHANFGTETSANFGIGRGNSSTSTGRNA
jgi:predicted O-methyltransferase YrrM